MREMPGSPAGNVRQRDGARERNTQYRVLGFALLGGGLLLAFLLLRNASGQGSAQLHTVMDTAASLFALHIGIIALLRYHAKPDDTILFIGAGFLGTALLDGHHAVVTSTWFNESWPSSPLSLDTWSWHASRLFLAILLAMSWWAGWRQSHAGAAARHWSPKTVYSLVATLTLASFFFFAFVPLPDPYFLDAPFGRPQEFVAALFFLVPLIGYLRKGAWKHNAFEYWLILSLIAAVLCQALFMSSSRALYDPMFDTAHLVKKLSYIFVLTGLLISMYNVFRSAEENLQAVQRSEKRLQSYFSIDLLGMAITSPEKAWLEVNGRLCTLLGYPEEELKTLTWEDLTHPGDLERERAEFNRLLRGERDGYSLEKRFVRKDKTVFPAMIGVRCLRSPSGTPEQFVALILDISEQKSAEAALQEINATLEQRVTERTAQLETANKELEAFSYSVSHDLRAPLRHLIGFSDLLQKQAADNLDEKAKRHLNLIRDAAQRMGQLIDDLLAFSRMGRAKMTRQTVNLDVLVKSVLSDFERDLEDREVQWSIASLPEIHGDPALLRQVLQNLLANALKFTRGRAPATIEFGMQPNRMTEDTFFVRDNGAGFDMQFADKLFSVFQRLHKSSEFEGTGIGLANVRRIVHRHGGRTWAEGEVGKGATFYFSLPKSQKETA